MDEISRLKGTYKPKVCITRLVLLISRSEYFCSFLFLKVAFARMTIFKKR